MTLNKVDAYVYRHIEKSCRRFFNHRGTIPLEFFAQEISDAHSQLKYPRPPPLAVADSCGFVWNPTTLEDSFRRMRFRHEMRMANKHLSDEDRVKYYHFDPAAKANAIYLAREATGLYTRLKRLGYNGFGREDVLRLVKGHSSPSTLTPRSAVAFLRGKTVFGELA